VDLPDVNVSVKERRLQDQETALTSQWVSVLLRSVVVCLGMACYVPGTAWAQDHSGKAVEEARQKRLEAEIAERKAELEERHRLELQQLTIEAELLHDELKLQEKQKYLERVRNSSLKDASPSLRKSMLDGIGRKTPPQTRPTQGLSNKTGLPSATDVGEDTPEESSQEEETDQGVEEDKTLVASGPAEELENAYLDRKIHVLLYANVNDKAVGGIGLGAKQNQKFLKSLFESQFQGRLRPVITNEAFRADSFARDLARLNVGPSDAVFIYISTHGGFGTDGEHYLSASGSAEISIRRKDIVSQLRKKCDKPDHLRVLITDSCGSFIGTAPRIGRETKPSPTQELFRLMMTTQGEVNVNAAVPGTQALYFSESSNAGGGLFTKAFVYLSVYGSKTRNSTGKASDWIPFLRQVSTFSQNSTPFSPRQPAACWFEPTGGVKRL
jgi:hypothetical protein